MNDLDGSELTVSRGASGALVNPESLPNRTDAGNASRFATQHAHKLRYCKPLGNWLVWDDRRWSIDRADVVMECAKETANEIARLAKSDPDSGNRDKLQRWSMLSESEARLKSMISLAKSIQSMRVLSEHLDSDPWLFNVLNGTIDLRSGTIREHRTSDQITKLAPVVYDPEAVCPNWDAFLREITVGSSELRDFLQRAVGYSLTGCTSEQVMFMPCGSGANGKSTFFNVLLAVLGDYATPTRSETLMKPRFDRIPHDVAALMGARLVTACEISPGQKLAEGLVKQLTGGDRVVARRLYQEFFTFLPEFKVWLSVNHKPGIEGDDHAIWRRILVIPFRATITEQDRDKSLAEKLGREASGVLTWAVRGCLQWQHLSSLDAPIEVTEATRSYRSESDILGQFIDDCCVAGEAEHVIKRQLFEGYAGWCKEQGVAAPDQLSMNGLSRRLVAKGFRAYRDRSRGQAWMWGGLRLRAVSDLD